MSYLEYTVKSVPSGIRKVLYMNWPLNLLLISVACVGFLMLYSVAGGSFSPWAEPQIERFGLGFAVMLAVAMVPIWFWRNMAALAYLLSLLLLVAVEFFGAVGMGAQRWIDLGFIRLQPSELAKITMVMMLAAYYDWLPSERISRPLWVLLPVAIILIPTWLWSIGLISGIDTLMYKLVWWGMGHSSQQINVSAHVAIWYAIAAVYLGAKPLSEKVSRMAFFLYILFLQLASAHHLLAEPGMSSTWKIVNTSYMMYLAVLGSLIHGLTVPGAIEAAQRRNGYTRGWFEWLTKAPWGNPAFSGMFMSLVMFGFIGGISGVVLGTEQLNVLMHNTIYVPGHFHGTVVAGTTLAFMAGTYMLVPIIFQRDILWPKLAKLQPYVFGIGAGGISLFMMGAGTLGVPRRSWDITLTDAAHAFEFPAAAYLMMGLNGISALFAATGGVMFILVVVGSILAGPKLDKAGAKLIFPLHDKGREAVTTYGSEVHPKLPGTIVLVTIFFTCFILYYFVNWKYLSELWLFN